MPISTLIKNMNQIQSKDKVYILSEIGLMISYDKNYELSLELQGN